LFKRIYDSIITKLVGVGLVTLLDKEIKFNNKEMNFSFSALFINVKMWFFFQFCTI